MAAPKLSDAVALRALEALKAAGGNQIHAAKALGLSPPTFQNQIRIAKNRFPKLYTPPKDGRPKKPPKTLAEQVDIQRAETARAKHRWQYDTALNRIAELEDKIRDLEWASKGSFKPAEWATPARSPKKSEHTPYLLTSDFQVGEVIRAEETEAGYGYDSKIFRKRYRHMISTVIYLSTQHAGALWKYPGIIYARGGDSISGDIHEELRETNDLTPIESVECVFEEESAGIVKLAEAFGRVEVKAPGSGGNHDRINIKPRAKRVHASSYDRLVAYMLRRHFARDQRVSFQVSSSFDVRFPIYDQMILLTHGDRIGSRGGQGFIGPAATIMRGAQKVIMEQAALGLKVDRVDMGHHHYPMPLSWVVCNGCMPGYSEYAKSYRMRPEPPQQFLFYHHPQRDMVDFKPIKLLDAK